MKVLPTLPVVVALAATASAQAELRYDNYGTVGQRIGATMDALGDLNGDGVGEYVSGAWDGDGVGGAFRAGAVRVHDGRTGDVLHEILGTGTSEQLGWSVAGVGDVDADGLPDYAGGSRVPYRLRVWSGATHQLLHEFTGDSSGESVDGIGDVNGDGHDDIAYARIVGGLKRGEVDIVSGKDGSKIRTITSPLNAGFADSNIDYFANELTGIEDVTGDGIGDLVIGSRGADSPSVNCGRVYVYNGATGALVRTITGSNGQQLGYSVEDAGDLNGDGWHDIVAGAWQDSEAGNQMGRVMTFDGRTGAVIHSIPSDGVMGRFGYDVTGVGDADGDGRDDFAGMHERARIRVFSGATGAEILEHTASTFWNPCQVTSVGDVNGDGFSDLLFGIASATEGVPGQTNLGTVRALSACAADRYGDSGDASQPLDLGWIPGPPWDVRDGDLNITGGTPGNPVVVFLKGAPDSFDFFGVEVLFDVLSTDYGVIDALFDGNGELRFDINLGVAGFDGISMVLQAFELALPTPSGFGGSNGMELYFCE